jgi:hypothetical protein
MNPSRNPAVAIPVKWQSPPCDLRKSRFAAALAFSPWIRSNQIPIGPVSLIQM